MKSTDNIMNGFSGWSQPYRFVVVRHTKWDKRQLDMKSFNIVDDPATAYMVYSELREADRMTQREVLFDWVLIDSFGRDALAFCKKMAEDPPSVSVSEEIKT